MCGLPPQWVLDEMTMYEAKILLDNVHLTNKDGWEQTRMQMWATVQPHSTKSIKATDMIKFPWDETRKKDTSISNEDIARLQKRADKISKQWQT